ncbi:efflux transporter outer membrane subunit [Paracandidimonas soli]|uniref:efflux transporter outer membrane subunit n=1 Tax=Paracandidimonas soli TaxID=1917182 RepID=UPI0033403B35
MIRRTGRLAAAGILAAALSACAVGPDHQRPDQAMGDHYRHAEGWVQVDVAAQAEMARDWWTTFSDARLDGLMAQLLRENLTLREAEARYRQAQAGLRSAQAGLFPTVGSNASATRSGGGDGEAGNRYSLSGNVSWEVDVWGRVRRNVEAGEASAQASAADLAATQLSLQSTLAQTYFRLLSLDAEKRLMEQTITAYERSLQMTENRYQAGVSAQTDVAASLSQLENARAQRLALERQRAVHENALAVLTGRPPSDFSLDETMRLGIVPVVPAGVPSQLLQRRPDIVAAERRVAEANARIGVAQAAWFPSLTLSAQGGYSSGQWAQWLSAPSQFWSLGPALALALFDGGARQASVDSARAAHEAQSAAYRQTVLTALREVEDYLVSLRVQEQEQATQARALEASRETLRLITNQYEAGMVDYLSVVQAQASALSAERTAISLQADRLVNSVQLITALGGGWDVSLLGQEPETSAP